MKMPITNTGTVQIWTRSAPNPLSIRDLNSAGIRGSVAAKMILAMMAIYTNFNDFLKNGYILAILEKNDLIWGVFTAGCGVDVQNDAAVRF